MTTEYLLIAVLAVLAYFVINGARQGFFRVIFSLISTLLALFLVSYMTPVISDALINHTQVYNIIYDKLESAFLSGTVSSVDVAGQTELINSYSIPKMIKSFLIENNTSDGYTQILVNVFGEYIVGFLARLIIRIIALVIIFLLIKFLFRSITIIFDVIDKIPILHGINRIMGAAVGFAEGFIIVSLFFLFMTIFTGDDIGNQFFNLVESNTFLAFIYDNNIFLRFVL
ncbi:MAG: CvpA family protein [Lachnospiraceae bacterium]|nr:CvpA family protein [Lachnospiraceae bacterium]